MKLDVFLDSGVSVEVPDGTDPDTEEGLVTVKHAAVEAFTELLTDTNMFDIQIEGGAK